MLQTMAVWKELLSFSVFVFLFNYRASVSGAPAGNIECPKESNNISASIKSQYSVIKEACRKELGKGETETQAKLSFIALSPCIEPMLQEVKNISELEKQGLIDLFTCDKTVASEIRDLKKENTSNTPSSERNHSKSSDLVAPADNSSSVSSRTRTEPNAKTTVIETSPSGENKTDGTTNDNTVVKTEGNKAEARESSNTVVNLLPFANETALSGNYVTVAGTPVSGRKKIDVFSNSSFVSTESGSDETNTVGTNNSTLNLTDTTSKGESKVLPKKGVVASAHPEGKIQSETPSEISGSNLTGLSTNILGSVDDSNITSSFNNTKENFASSKASSISSEFTNSSAESISTTASESALKDITTLSTSEGASPASPTIAESYSNSSAASNTALVFGTPVAQPSTVPAVKATPDLVKTTQSGTPTSVQP